MNKWELFQKFLITENAQINIQELLINSAILIALALILEFTYYKCAYSLSNKKLFAKNFILTAFTTMVIIAIVKTSLALSLGLVGALSIVRFRAAIKEPEELAYLFFTIAIGLGMGANQVVVTVLSSLILFTIIWVRFLITKNKNEFQNLFLTINTSPKNIEFDQITDLVQKHFKKSQLKRFDETETTLEASFYIDVKKINNIQAFKKDIDLISKSTNVAFVDNNV